MRLETKPFHSEYMVQLSWIYPFHTVGGYMLDRSDATNSFMELSKRCCCHHWSAAFQPDLAATEKEPGLN